MPEASIPVSVFPLIKCIASGGRMQGYPDIYLKNVVRGAFAGHLMVVLFKQATGDLFTAAGAFIKNVHCPKGAAAVRLLGVDGRGRLSCRGCSRRIHDVRLKTEAQVVALVKADPKACLLLDRRNLSLS